MTYAMSFFSSYRLLFGPLQVTTVDGIKDLQIPPGCQPGEKIKMSKMGVPDMNRSSVRGDHIFLINVQIPKNLSDAERTLVEKLASLRVTSKHHSVSSDGERRGVARLWKPVKDFLRIGRSSRRFASVSTETTAVWSLSRPLPSFPLMTSLSAVLFGTYIRKDCYGGAEISPCNHNLPIRLGLTQDKDINLISTNIQSKKGVSTEEGIGLYMVTYVECLTFGEGVQYVDFDSDLLGTRYASILWYYDSRKEEEKAQSDDEAPMRHPRKNGITEDTEVHEI
ncbi:hypothetical protein FXO37_31363 [Capsicum annuum]|nr:hypothetical protein FXO37_31363 [Capsicum annuum]